MQGHRVSGTIHLGDQVSQTIRTVTYRFGTSRHPTQKMQMQGDRLDLVIPTLPD